MSFYASGHLWTLAFKGQSRSKFAVANTSLDFVQFKKVAGIFFYIFRYENHHAHKLRALHAHAVQRLRADDTFEMSCWPRYVWYATIFWTLFSSETMNDGSTVFEARVYHLTSFFSGGSNPLSESRRGIEKKRQ